MIFRQLFEPISSTYTYLLGCEETGQALLIDPVLPSWERDLAAVNALGLKLAFTLETHIHADQRDHLAGFLARGERAVRRWQAELPSTTVRFDAAAFANINRPDDLRS